MLKFKTNSVFLIAAMFAVLGSATASWADTQLIQNGGFEQGTNGWTFQGAVVSSGCCPHSGARYDVFGGVNNANDYCSQGFVIPAGATQVSLSFWVHITSTEPPGGAYDSFIIRLLDAYGNWWNLGDYSNQTPTSSYQQSNWDLSQFRGQNVIVWFSATTDGSYPTTFRVDDVSCAAQTAQCTYSVAPSDASFSPGGGGSSFGVNTQTGCAWTASVTSGATWITITGGTSGTGNGQVIYGVSPNSGTSQRSGQITAAGQTHTVTQLGAIQDDPSAGDDYPHPFREANCVSFDSSAVDCWNFYVRQCTSFVAWRMNRDAGITQTDLPLLQYPFSNQMTGRIDRLGNATDWANRLAQLGYRVDHVPTIGAIAHWTTSEIGGGFPGHVAYVRAVHSDGTVQIEEYNKTSCAYSSRTIPVANVGRFIHFGPTHNAGGAGGGGGAGVDESSGQSLPVDTMHNQSLPIQSLCGAGVCGAGAVSMMPLTLAAWASIRLGGGTRRRLV